MNATEKVWMEYHAKLLTFILNRVHDRPTAEDILQNIFLKIHAQIESLREETKLESWLYQLSRNTIIDYYRSRKQTLALPPGLAQEDSEPNEQAMQELEACLRPMIEQLPEHYREALILSELDGKTQHDVSIQQNISLSGAKSRIQRGRALLKGMLYQCCQFEFDQQGNIIDFNPKRNGIALASRSIPANETNCKAGSCSTSKKKR